MTEIVGQFTQSRLEPWTLLDFTLRNRYKLEIARRETGENSETFSNSPAIGGSFYKASFQK
jgi:hypothetical protein